MYTAPLADMYHFYVDDNQIYMTFIATTLLPLQNINFGTGMTEWTQLAKNIGVWFDNTLEI